MRKILLPGILTVFALFLPLKSQAVPLDVPFQLALTTTSTTGSIVISTTNFPSGVPSVNASVANYQWCFDRITVSCPNADSFSIFWSTSALTAGTTDYVVITSSGVPFDADFGYREPYCAPVGQPVVTLKSSVTGSTISASGYLWKGWSP